MSGSTPCQRRRRDPYDGPRTPGPGGLCDRSLVGLARDVGLPDWCAAGDLGGLPPDPLFHPGSLDLRRFGTFAVGGLQRW